MQDIYHSVHREMDILTAKMNDVTLKTHMQLIDI